MPSDEKLGIVTNIRIDATAAWLGQTGTAAITQGRSFEYKVTVLSKEFTETILEKAPERKDEVVVVKEEEKLEEEKAPKVAEKEAQVGVPTSTFVGVVIVLLIIIAGLFIFFVMKKK